MRLLVLVVFGKAGTSGALNQPSFIILQTALSNNEPHEYNEYACGRRWSW